MVTDKALWLASYLHSKKRATQKQIARAWANENVGNGKEMPRRTFQETREKVERLFDTIIDYDAHTKEYYFADEKQLADNAMYGWLFNALSLTATLQKYKQLQ